MRRKSIVVALAVGLCAMGIIAAPALAAKEKPVFGKFKASASGTAKGIGEAGEMTLGPYHFEECEKELHSNGAVTMGESETFFQEVKFSHCETSRKLSGGLEEVIYAGFTLGMEFHSNGTLKLGPNSTTFKAGASECEVTIPAQWVPAVAGEPKGQEKLYEYAGYSTETEKLEGGQLKKFGEFRERLDIEWELKGIVTTVKQSPTCRYAGSHLNSAGEAEIGGGKMEGELEEVTLNTGNLSFVPPAGGAS